MVEERRERRQAQLVSLEALGFCEHCEAILNMENMPPDAMDAEWKCFSCEGTLTGKTFGYEQKDGKWEKTRWIGPGKKWVEQRPTEDFSIGSLFVVVRRPPILYLA